MSNEGYSQCQETKYFCIKHAFISEPKINYVYAYKDNKKRDSKKWGIAWRKAFLSSHNNVSAQTLKNKLTVETSVKQRSVSSCLGSPRRSLSSRSGFLVLLFDAIQVSFEEVRVGELKLVHISVRNYGADLLVVKMSSDETLVL